MEKVASTADVLPTNPTFEAYGFQHDILGKSIRFEILKMNTIVLIWIGNSDDNFNDLALAMLSPKDPIPVVTSILGNETSTATLAKKLTKRLNKPVYFSYNVNRDILSEVEKRLAQEISNKPEKF